VRRVGWQATLLVVLVVVGGCSSEPPAADAPPAARPSGSQNISPTPPSRTPSSTTTTTPTTPTSTPRPSRPPDPRWQFFTDDRTRWASPWYAGRHRVMIPFGCTAAPFYDPDPTCPGGQGFHHGIDVAIPCGTPLTAARPATVLDHGALGPAYGTNPVLLRVAGQDVVIGHTVRVYVAPGDDVARGESFARVGDSAAPDGCHLHFEVRPPGGDYTSAVDPRPLLDLRRP
jgi:murein DD-endopeptidase MepM/ murein hydrolase activator NlpD